MELEGLTVGTKINLVSGATAEVLAPTDDGETVRVRYLESPFEPALEATEAVCSHEEVAGVLSGAELTGTTSILRGRPSSE